MTKTVAYCALIVSGGIVVVISVYSPRILSDQNSFLFSFVNHNFLNVLGVILAITLASAAQLHLTFNRIEERYQQRGLVKTRANLHRAAFWLIGLFIVAILLVIIKPIIADTDAMQSLFNGAAAIILLWNALILISITQAIFAIKADIEDE